MPIYENLNMTNEDSFSIYAVSDLTWQAHFHRALEVMIVLKGEVICTVNKHEYLLSEGEAVLVMPNQIHSIDTMNSSRVQLVRFSPSLVGSFYKRYENKIPADNRFKVIHPLAYEPKGLIRPENIFVLKGILYSLIGDFCLIEREWLDASPEHDIIYKTILFIEENFKQDCTLKDAAKHLNYDYTYISREFLRVTGLTFSQYLNNCRINHACCLLENTDMPITQIARESGYDTLRTFNRNFIRYTGTSPSKYLKNKDHLHDITRK